MARAIITVKNEDGIAYEAVGHEDDIKMTNLDLKLWIIYTRIWSETNDMLRRLAYDKETLVFEHEIIDGGHTVWYSSTTYAAAAELLLELRGQDTDTAHSQRTLDKATQYLDSTGLWWRGREPKEMEEVVY